MTIFRKEDYYKPLEKCSRKQDKHGVSEYLTMLAISRMPAEFSETQLKEEMREVITNDTLGKLVDKGLMQAIWDDKQQAIVYTVA